MGLTDRHTHGIDKQDTVPGNYKQDRVPGNDKKGRVPGK